MVFTSDMPAFRWAMASGSYCWPVGKDVSTEAMPVEDILQEIGWFPGEEGTGKLYNLFRKFNKRYGDFYDGDYFVQEKHYSMPRDSEKMMEDLAALSLTHKIVAVDHKDYGIGLLLMESEDGTTNIDASVIEAMVGAFGKKAKRRRRVGK